MSEPCEPPTDTVGYRRPPRASQFKPGQSGNPRGRPKRAKKSRKHFLDTPVDVMVNGKRVTMRCSVWFFWRLERLAMEGSPAVARMLVEADERIERAKKRYKVRNTVLVEKTEVDAPTFCIYTISHAILSLGMARKAYAYSSTARIVLEPWVVQAAFDRYEGPELTPEGQKEVFAATRCPHQVRWPDWWLPEYRGSRRKCRKAG
ncbi:MAG: DUF5681 domain-containing protein [Novosphingobium sp.]